MIRFDPDIEALIGEPVASNVPVVTVTGDLAAIDAAYDGGSTRSEEMMLWNVGSVSADGAILPNKSRTDARNHDTLRNDGYVQGAATLHKDSIVGANFMCSLQPNSKVLYGKEDVMWEDEYAEEVETKFQTWADSDENWVDASRINNFTSLVRLAVGISVPTGEVLATVEWKRDWPGFRPYNTAIQMVDLDRLCNPTVGTYGSLDRTVGGIQQDEDGAAEGYWIRKAHVSDYRNMGDDAWRYSPKYKPWGRIQVIHLYEQNRAHQSRGIAQMVAALKEMKQTKRFRDIVLQNAVLNATFAASIESELPTQEIFARLGAGATDADDVADAVNAYMGGYLTEIGKYMGGSKALTLDGVRIPHLPPGSKLQMRPAGQGSPIGSEFEQSLLRHISAALGVSYEEMSRDFSQTNYSGFKGALAVTQRGMATKKKLFADRFANHIFKCWYEEAWNRDGFETLKRRKTISLYEGMNREYLTNANWIGASFGQIDELKETQAAVLRVNAGFSTMAIECARLGKDWRQIMRQLRREKNWKVFYKILLDPVDTQNMMNATEDAGNADGQNTKKDQ